MPGHATLLPDQWKGEHPDAVRAYRVEESRYKADRKQVSRARRIIAANQKREQIAFQPA